MTIIIISFAFTISLASVSLVLEVYLKRFEVTEDSNRIIIGLIENSTLLNVIPPENTISFIKFYPENRNQNNYVFKKPPDLVTSMISLKC